MTTTIRPKLSKENEYYVEKHRYYELKHFCLQYPEWKRLYIESDGLRSSRYDEIYSRGSGYNDSTASVAEYRIALLDKIKLIEQTSVATDEELSKYILKGVSEGLSYNYLKSRLEIPCGRELYYKRYRRFFWLLDKIKN